LAWDCDGCEGISYEIREPLHMNLEEHISKYSTTRTMTTVNEGKLQKLDQVGETYFRGIVGLFCDNQSQEICLELSLRKGAIMTEI
jgi:hypothetical protein